MKTNLRSEWRREMTFKRPIVQTMLDDLYQGIITPVASSAELQVRYRGHFAKAGDLTAALRQACILYADKVGTVLALIDATGKMCLGYTADPGVDLDDPLLLEACEHVLDNAPQNSFRIAINRAREKGHEKAEFPMYILPTYEYKLKDGPKVVDNGRYLASVWQNVA